MEFRNHIDARWVKGSVGTVFESIHPANEIALAESHAADRHDVDFAIEAATRALEIR